MFKSIFVVSALFLSGCLTSQQASVLPDCEKLEQTNTTTLVSFMERDAYDRLSAQKGLGKTYAFYEQGKGAAGQPLHYIYITMPRENTSAGFYLNTICHELRHAQGWRH